MKQRHLPIVCGVIALLSIDCGSDSQAPTDTAEAGTDASGGTSGSRGGDGGPDGAIGGRAGSAGSAGASGSAGSGAAAGSGSSAGTPPPTPNSVITWTKNHEGASQDASFGEWQSAVVSHNGHIYSTWIDAQGKTILAKIPEAGGAAQQVVVLEDTDLDKYHTMPSVAVDDAGYIHVVGNSHNNPYPQISSMQAAGNGDCSHPNANAVANAGTVCASPLPYYVSATPEDITSMEFVPWTSPQQIPGTRITYATFFAANTGELFVTFRQRVEPGGSDPGDRGAAIARYDSTQRTWKMLGSNDYTQSSANGNIDASAITSTSFDSGWFTYNGTSTTWAWSAEGVDGSSYQGFRPRLWFDASNRLHAVSQFHFSAATVTSQANIVFYAYSDDLGDTWHRADGSPQPLPITPANADIVDQTAPASQGEFYTLQHVCATAAGEPVVGYWYTPDNTSRLRKWSGSAWVDAMGDLADNDIRVGLIASDRFGILTGFGHNRLVRSWDGGDTWHHYVPDDNSPQTNVVQPPAVILDQRYLFQTGNVRFQALNNDGQLKATVWTAAFSAP